MKKILCILCVLAMMGFAACADLSKINTISQKMDVAALSTSQALVQVAGVAQGLSDIVQTSPLDSNSKAQAVNWANFAAGSAAELAQGLGNKDHLAGALSAVSNIAMAAPLDADTKVQVSNYVSWGSTAASVLGLVLKLAPLALAII